MVGRNAGCRSSWPYVTTGQIIPVGLMNNTESKTMKKKNSSWLNIGAMLGFVALLGAYLTTGQIIPGFIYKKFT